MPFLKRLAPAELAQRIEEMEVASLRRHSGELESLIHHRDPMVRLSVARALAKAGRGASALRTRMEKERNVLVLSEICDSLSSLRDEASLSQLRLLAEEHKSPLVRSYALLAIADISGRNSISYLQERRKKERSRRIRATLDCALFAKGANEALPDLLEDLLSPDFRVRNLVTNLLYHYAPRRKRSIILGALREAAAREPFQGVRGDMERAIAELSG